MKFLFNIKSISIFFILLILTTSFSSVFAYSLPDIDIVVKETVINEYQYNPYTGEPLTFAHIGYLQLGPNDNPSKCLAMVYGLIMETELPKANPVANFLVCVYKDISGELNGIIIEKQNRF